MTQQTYIVPTSDIAVLPEFQVRTDMDGDRIMRYSQVLTECMENGEKSPFPPVLLYKIEDPVIGEMLVLVDGFHRHMAEVDAGMNEHLAYVIEGTREDAMLACMFANYDHDDKGVALKRRERMKAFRTLAEIKKDEIEADPTLLTKLAMEINPNMTERTARRDSQAVRKEIKERLERERNARIKELSEEGMSIRAIAEEIGIGKDTVARQLKAVAQRSSVHDATPEDIQEPEADDDVIEFTGFEEEDDDFTPPVNPWVEMNAKLAEREAKAKEKAANQGDTVTSNCSTSRRDTIGEARPLDDYSPEELLEHLEKRMEAAGNQKILKVMEKNNRLQIAVFATAKRMEAIVASFG